MKNRFTIILKKDILLKELKSYTWVFAGSALLAITYVIFIIPHNIVPGGILGLSIVLNKLTGLSIGLLALMINIPLLLWGTKVLGVKTGLKTAFSMILVSFYIDVFSTLLRNKIFIEDVLVSSVFGGVIIGLSVFIVMKAGATTGGNDILVRILATKIKLPYSQLILVIDGIVIFLGVFVFEDFTMAAYSVIAIVAISKTIEYFINKAMKNMTLLVFSSKSLLIQESILENKKCTDHVLKLIHYDTNGKLILLTKNTKKLETVREMIYRIDPKATISVLESNSDLN
ncbi:YitT family protein [Xanthomarina sp. F1114]|uniref:YitT family protein n=1 Tax=Xanthomarina sp. F1114 TaxID=2996019 RepID=UPI00225E3378|nr:YitT family protein [Xanthomarina sp. F1114]MCX7547611.1 YitT family protein [Xanthomarina sp. F1114]